MKKTFPFEKPPHAPARVVEGIKNEIRKYLKRERRKPLPEGADFWDFDCKAGPSPEQANPVHPGDLIQTVDRAATEGWADIHLEIVAKPASRTGGRES